MLEKELKKTDTVEAQTQDYLTKVQQFKMHINCIETKMECLMLKTEISLSKTVHAHSIELYAIGRQEEGTINLYINLLYKSMESNRKKEVISC